MHESEEEMGVVPQQQPQRQRTAWQKQQVVPKEDYGDEPLIPNQQHKVISDDDDCLIDHKRPHEPDVMKD
jgi:hypothetical protein